MNDTSNYILEVNRDSFNTQVILNSYKMPVLVEFMGVWSGPCIQLHDIIVDCVREFPGQFMFVKVDVDEQAELKQEYAIENIPTLKVFVDGNVVLTEAGMLQANEVQDLLKSLGIYRQSDELRDQARVKHMNGDSVAAVQLLTQAIQQDPSNTRVAMDMTQVMIDVDELDQATAIFNKLPDRDKESEFGRLLLGQLSFRQLASKTSGKEQLLQRLADNNRDYDAHFDLAVCLVAEHEYLQAMEHLFAIFEQEPLYKEGAAREMIINLANMLAANEPNLAQEFRRRLGNAVA